MTEKIASIVIVTYNCKKYIKQCIDSILKQNYPFEIIIVDNRSNDGTVELIRYCFPFVKIIINPINFGYGKGNNIGVKEAIGEYVVILNPDTIVSKDWLKELIKPLENNDRLITVPKVLLYKTDELAGYENLIHFTGLAFIKGYKVEPSLCNKIKYVNGILGCCFALKKEHYFELGGFDERLFLYHDDIDFSWKINLKRFKIMLVPDSIIRHDYIFFISDKKIYNLEKGRYLVLKKYYHLADIVLLLPSLLITEILTLGYAFRECGLRGAIEKFKGMKDIFFIKIKKEEGDYNNLLNTLCKVLPLNDHQLRYNKVIKMLVYIINNFFKLNFELVRLLNR